MFKDSTTAHAADAQNFSDEEELADDELPDEEFSSEAPKAANGDDDNNNSGDESEDDLMKELQQEAMQGVDENEAEAAGPGGLFDNTFSNNNAGLADLDFEHSNALADDHDDEELNMGFQMASSEPNMVDEDDIDLSDEYENEEQKAAIQKELKEKIRLERIEKEKRNRAKLLRIYYPSFKRGLCYPQNYNLRFTRIPEKHSE
ncbi:unnamed protein product [Ambrosiozyma monospora]|uniref:Unnamed protein product n=1 Tax=Ambrosiozyma monospora TaxID=43982 RepID=A0A9W6T7J9_AMBMO|nr:unnamed protein product [Ambrosiozyma monospora]